MAPQTDGRLSGPAGPAAPVADSPVTRWFDALAAHFEEVVRHGGEHRATVAVGGTALLLRFAGSALRDALLPPLPRADSVVPATWTVCVLDGSAARPLPLFPFSPSDAGARGDVASATQGAIRTSWFAPSGALSTVDVSRRIAIFLVPDARTLPWYERAAPMRTLFHWILSEEGHRFVHAAAVALPDGTCGALIAAPGGSGKSTTAMLCLRHGFGYAGDDYVAVTPPGESGEVVAHRIYSTAKLSARSLEWLPFLAPGVLVAPDGDEKAVVDLQAVAPRQIVNTVRVGALVVPRLSAGSARLTRISSAEALRAVAPTTLLQLPGNGHDAFRDIAAIVARLPAWGLALGDDPGAVPAEVARAAGEAG